MDEDIILIGVATRPFPGETANGDSWRVDWHDGVCRIAVIDALGHGPDAAREADRTIAALAQSPTLAPDASVKACHAALHGGRGAAVGIIEIDSASSSLTFCGLGNVEGVVLSGAREQRLSGDRGIVGAVMGTLHPVTIPLAAGWMLLVHTDGVSSRFHIVDVLDGADSAPDLMAQTILDRFGRSTDDATILVARAVA